MTIIGNFLKGKDRIKIYKKKLQNWVFSDYFIKKQYFSNVKKNFLH